MKVLFIKDNLPTAMAGEIKEVKSGFARNYLIPQGIAERANKSSIVRIEKLKKEAEVRRLDMKQRWEKVAKDIDNLKLDIVAQTGPTGRLFGSITSAQISSAIEANLESVVIDRRSIRIQDPIKMIGDYIIPIKLFEGVDSEVKITVKSDTVILSEEVVEIVDESVPQEEVVEIVDESVPQEDVPQEDVEEKG